MATRLSLSSLNSPGLSLLSGRFSAFQCGVWAFGFCPDLPLVPSLRAPSSLGGSGAQGCLGCLWLLLAGWHPELFFSLIAHFLHLPRKGLQVLRRELLCYGFLLLLCCVLLHVPRCLCTGGCGNSGIGRSAPAHGFCGGQVCAPWWDMCSSISQGPQRTLACRT